MSTKRYCDQPIARSSTPCRGHSSRRKSLTRLHGVSRGLLAALLVAVLCIPASALAAACPGYPDPYGNYLTAANQTRATMTPSRPLYAFIGTGCTHAAMGDATVCDAVAAGNGAWLFAWWPYTSVRTGDATGGCSFMCQNGDCFVGNDGLPVELLRFGVE